jgi:hypothetical protein
VLRLGSGGLQQGRHLFVRMQCRSGQVPGSPVRLIMQRLGELAVRGGPLRERSGVVKRLDHLNDSVCFMSLAGRVPSREVQ